MANTILTPTMVTRKALMILHQKLNFIGSINRQYDDSFANEGARIGDTLKIRLPNQYTVRSGATISTQDTAENSVSLQVATQKGVDVNFTSKDLTLGLDDFATRILDPAMAVLASVVESDAMSMFKDVYNSTWNMGSANTLAKTLATRVLLQRSLAPVADRTANLNSQDMVDLINDTKTLFQDSKSLSDQYKEGSMGRAAGFDFMENTIWPGFTRGNSNTAYTTNSLVATLATDGTAYATITVTSGANAPLQGDVFTIGNCFSVHPETKISTGVLQQFVINAAGATTTSFPISPSIILGGALQNVTIPTTSATAAIAFLGTANTATGTSLLYHKNAFAFATADLVMPKGVDFAAREVQDGISLRIVRNYDIINDKFPCRIDIMYGYKTIRPQLAARQHNN